MTLLHATDPGLSDCSFPGAVLMDPEEYASRRELVSVELAWAKRHLSLDDYLAEEFRLLNVKPHITHLKQPYDCYYCVITVAASCYVPYQDHADDLAIIFASASNLNLKGSNLDRFLVKEFANLGYGVAPCHAADNFSRKRGRIMSEGRLFKLLRKEMAQCM